MQAFHFSIAVTMLSASGAAQAAFYGGMMSENLVSSVLSSQSANGPSRVFDLYIVFDEADDVLSSIRNANFASIDGSGLIQNGVSGAAQDTDGDLNPGAWATNPETQWDSYVAIGGPFPGASNTTTQPDFAFTVNGVLGGWHDTPGGDGSRQGVASDGVEVADGLWGVFAGQFVLEGSDGFRGAGGGLGNGFIGSRFFQGILDIDWLDELGGPAFVASEVGIHSGIPAPGTVALFAIGAAATGRRRR